MKYLLSFFIFFSFQVNAEVVNTKPRDIVDVKTIDPTIQVDMMYLSSFNFVGQPIDGYKANICYLTRAAGEALKKAQSKLKKINPQYSLFIRDCYRPQKAVKNFINWAEDSGRTEMKSIFYPDLNKSQLIPDSYISPTSGHSHGSTVDLTIGQFNEQGDFEAINMGSAVDFFGEKSHTAFKRITMVERENRDLLLNVMSADFKNYSKEWWHFVLKNDPYPKTFFDFDVN
jgi:zinc D-Ala-D-Ala dipeptidase